MKSFKIPSLKKNEMMYIGSALLFLVLVAIGVMLYMKNKPNKEKFENAKKVLYFFRAEWCGHCQRFKPVWDEFVHDAMTSSEFPNVEIVELDIDKEESKPLMKKHGVQGFPHVVLAEESRPDIVFHDARTKEALQQFLRNNN
jgi:thiol-disulfide isomerase/thioredoxin